MRLLCWLCNKPLTYTVSAKPLYALVPIDGAQRKVHKVCGENAGGWIDEILRANAQRDVKQALR